MTKDSSLILLTITYGSWSASFKGRRLYSICWVDTWRYSSRLKESMGGDGSGMSLLYPYNAIRIGCKQDERLIVILTLMSAGCMSPNGAG